MTKSESGKEATVADVALRAGVSKAQAARALGAYGAVSDTVRDLVLAAAEEMGYRPNQLARSMNTGKSQTLGVVVGDIENPYFGLAVRGISDTARSHGYNVILLNTSEQLALEEEAVQVLLDKRVDGFIIAPCSTNSTKHLREIGDRGRPLVLFDRWVVDIDLDVVSVDFEQVSIESTRYLLAAGHTRIAYISSLNTGGLAYSPETALGGSPVTQRIGGISAALRERGHELDPSLIKLNAMDPEAVDVAVGELLDLSDPPTAFVASDSLIAQGTLAALKNRGLKIPDDVSFMMYDDFPWTDLITPPLTVVRQPIYEMGATAASRVLCLIDGTDPGPMPLLKAEVIYRDSITAPTAHIGGN